LFLSGYHLHDRQRKSQRPRLLLELRKCSDRDSVPVRKRVGNYLKFLPVDADSLGFRIAHAFQSSADFVDFDGMLAGGQSIHIDIHGSWIVSDKHPLRIYRD
jgi:hypothetical protein